MTDSEEATTVPCDVNTKEPVKEQNPATGSDNVSNVKIKTKLDSPDKLVHTTTATLATASSTVTTVTTSVTTPTTPSTTIAKDPESCSRGTENEKQSGSVDPIPATTSCANAVAVVQAPTDGAASEIMTGRNSLPADTDGVRVPEPKRPVKTPECVQSNDVKEITANEAAICESAAKEAAGKETTAHGVTIPETAITQKAGEHSAEQKDAAGSSRSEVAIKQEILSPKDSPTVDDKAVCKNENVSPKTEIDMSRTDAKIVTSEESNSDKPHEPLEAGAKELQLQVKDGQTPASEETTSNMGVMLQAVKIKEEEPSVEMTVKTDNSKENELVMREVPENPPRPDDAPETTESEAMQVDEKPPVPGTNSDCAAAPKKEPVPPEAAVAASKAVHEIIAEQSVRAEREGTALPPASSEKEEGGEVSVPAVKETKAIPETRVEIKDAVDDDWDIPASDEEEDGSEQLQGEVGEAGEEKRRRVGVKRGYWEPPVEVIVELYRRLDREGILELSWKCPGRRPPSVEGDEEEEKALPEEETNEEEMEISQEEEDPTEFDFDIDTDSSVQKMTPRRGIGSGQAQGSGKKRVARMDKVLSDIFRHRKIDSAALTGGSAAEEKTTTEDSVAKETDEAMDTGAPASNVTPSRPPDKFHIRSDLT